MTTNKSNQFATAASSGHLFQLLHLLFDIGALLLAWYVTVELRLALNPYMPIAIPRERMHTVAQPILSVLLLWIAVSLWLGSYRDRGDHSTVAALLKVAESAAVVSTLVVVVTFFSRSLGADLSRSFVLLLAPVSFLHLVGSLWLSIWVASAISRRWLNPRRVAVLGAGMQASDLAKAIHRAADSRISLCGFILPEYAAGGGLYGGAPSYPVLGTTRQLAELINRECLDRIIVADDAVPRQEFEYCGAVTRQMGVTVSRPVYAMGLDVRVRHQTEFGLHFVHMHAAEFSPWRLSKRALDVAGSLAMITALMPLFVALACLIRLTSEGPIFFRSQRVGKGGRYFTFWKFRSMYINGPSRQQLAEQNERSGHLFKIRDDPRVTPIGRVMRRLSLDELPQLFNVLAGDMSLVGPRPLPSEDLEPDGMSSAFGHWAAERARVRPGITGLWQIKGRSELPFDEMARLDVEYISTWSLLLDLRILAATPKAVFTGRGAY